MKGHEENFMKEFWLRPALQKRSVLSNWWNSFMKGDSSSVRLFFVFLLLLFSLLFFAGWIDLAKYTRYTSEKVPKYITRNHKSTTIEVPLDCAAWNLTNTCPNNYPKTFRPSSSESTTCPEYFRWIHEDLRHWKLTGVTREMVEKAKTAHFRLTILDGKVYVEKFRDAIQTRDLFTIWGIAQLVRWYPGKLPDLEMMFDADDRPVVPKAEFQQPDSAPPPLFRYCSDFESMDIVFPDWSFWGWAEVNIRPWRSVLKEIIEGTTKIKWEDRVPYAYWKGNPTVCPWREDLMKCNVTPEADWNARLYVQDWIKESEQGYKQSKLGDQCTHRYKIYIEGWAWSVSEKYIFACDSPVLQMTLRWHDFFSRGMVPQRHYWPVRDSDKCKSLKFAVEWGNSHTKKAKAIGTAGSRFIHEDLKMEYIYDYMFHLLNEYGKLMEYTPTISPNATEVCPESLACKLDGVFREFMEESLEKSPSLSEPCAMPPQYKPQELQAFTDAKMKKTEQVEKWENEYWDKQNKNQQ